MVCKTKPSSDETLTCKTCVTPWHVACLAVRPPTMADAVSWECPDCLPLSGDAPATAIGASKPIRDEARRVIGAVLVFRDITERKQMEERLAQAETFRAVGAMAAGCAHHLNNLFTVILGYNELALKTVGDPEVLRSLWVVNKAVRDGAEVVGRIRHVTSGAPSPELVPVDLNEIVEQVVELARPIWKDQTKARGSVIEVSLDCARIPMVPGDPLSLCEALLNPFLNAIEAPKRSESS